MTSKQLANYEQFRELPSDYLKDLGDSAERNGEILSRLLALPQSTSTLVFACSVEHASILTLALNRAFNDTVAAIVIGSTPRAERLDAIEAFREGKLRFLCNWRSDDGVRCAQGRCRVRDATHHELTPV